VWDGASQNTEDGGYVIGSDVSDSGKWILLWDDEVMPSSVYGVKAGQTEGNIPLLLGYPAVVGSFQLATAPVVRFLPGIYTSSTTWATDKELVFDMGATFTGASFSVPRARVLGLPSTYVADFVFTGSDAEAHSSWFRTVTGFWACGAPRLVIDKENHFADLTLRGKPDIEKAVITGTARIPMTYINGNYLTFTRCAFAAKEIFSPVSDFVRFAGMRWNDSLWNDSAASHYDFGRVSQGHHIEFLSSGANTIDLDDFGNAMIYLMVLESNIDVNPGMSTVLDLEGRSLGSFSSSHFTVLKNAHVTGNINLSGAPSGFRMDNVTCDGSVNGGINPVVKDCILRWGLEWTGTFTSEDSEISGNAVTGVHDIIFTGGRWRKSILNATDNLTNTGTILFRDAVLDGVNAQIHTKNLNLIRCGVYNQKIELYPYYDAGGSRFLFNTRIEHSEINGDTPVAYKIFHDLGDGCKDCVLACTWIGNSWFGNEKGLTMEFWADSSVYSQVLSRDAHYVVYSGNSGNCPLEAWHGDADPVSWSQCAFYPADGDAPLTNFYRANIDMRCCPNWNKPNAVHGTTYGAWISPAYQISGGATTKGYLSATNPMPSYLGYGDAFETCIVKYGSAGDTRVTYV